MLYKIIGKSQIDNLKEKLFLHYSEIALDQMISEIFFLAVNFCNSE